MSSGPPPSPPHKRDRIPQSTRESAAHRARCSSSFLLLSLGSRLRRTLAWIPLRNGGVSPLRFHNSVVASENCRSRSAKTVGTSRQLRMYARRIFSAREILGQKL